MQTILHRGRLVAQSYVNIRVWSVTKRRLKVAAAMREISMAALVHQLVRNEMGRLTAGRSAEPK